MSWPRGTGCPRCTAGVILSTTGGLISYGPNIELMVKKAASYVDRIIKSEKPGDLPVQQPTKFDLAINLKTTRSLGITIPQSVLIRADHVVQ